MFVSAVVVSTLLASLVAFTAVRKLSHRPEVVQTYVRVGVPEDKLDCLAAILLGGAVGLIAGLFWAPVGIVAALGLVVYFLLAVGAHIGARDIEHLRTPIAIELISASALALRLVTA
jgi:hypothetical protein